jgi:hypothetical protein
MSCQSGGYEHRKDLERFGVWCLGLFYCAKFSSGKSASLFLFKKEKLLQKVLQEFFLCMIGLNNPKPHPFKSLS